MHRVVITSLDGDQRDRHAVDAERVLGLSPSAISYWDPDLHCRYANRACADWFGIDPEILVGSSLESSIDLLRLGTHFALIGAALQGECRSTVQTFHDGLAKRDGLVQYVPDVRGHLVRGLLIQVGSVPAVARLARFKP
jgi:PAS domain-containing protein